MSFYATLPLICDLLKNVLSNTFPVVTLFIFVLTNAGPFPGFTCKKFNDFKNIMIVS